MILDKVVLLKKITSDIPLMQKLMLSYVFLIVFPLAAFFILSYRDISRSFEEQVMFSLNNSLSQSAMLLDNQLATVKSSAFSVITGKSFNEVIKSSSNSKDIYSIMSDSIKMSELLISFQDKELVVKVNLFLSKNFKQLNNSHNVFDIDTISESYWYKYFASSGRNSLWIPESTMQIDSSDTKALYYIMGIKDNKDYSRQVGFIRIDVSSDRIREILKNAAPTRNGIIYLQNEAGELLISSSSESIAALGIDKAFRQDLSMLQNGWSVIPIKGSKFAKSIRKIPNSDWFVIAILPYNEITQTSQRMLFKMLGVIVALLVMSMLTAYLIAFVITKKLKLVVSKMQEAHSGKINPILISPSKDEVGQLIKSYNYMTDTIKQLLEDKFQLGKKVTETELQALQAQINPHFLYNTLELAGWIAVDNDPKGVQEVLKSLTNYYKLTLNNGKHIVTIGEELSHIREYLLIQNKRFDDSIRLIIDVTSEMEDYAILKLTLQPLVENSILHGIRLKPDRRGTITIRGCKGDNTLVLEIIDDGVGIEAQKLKYLFCEKKQGNVSGSYGVRNVHERLRLCFGESYGLVFESRPGEYTIARILLPLQKLHKL